jgi:hypothetical protein
MVGTDTVDAYLAGAIDIDGHISIIRKRGYRRHTDGRQMTYYVARVSLSDASPVVPDLLQSTFPARRSTYRARNRLQKEWHMWEAANQTAREPLARLLPHLRLKRRQAELALSLIALLERDAPAPFKPLSDEEDEARRLLFEEAALLNAARPQRLYR